MNKAWTTVVDIPEGTSKINFKSHVLYLGSCFSTHMAEQSAYYQIPHTVNPFGIVFNPGALAILIKRVANRKLFTKNEVLKRDGLFFCLEAGSAVFGTDLQAFINYLNNTLQLLYTSLTKSTHVIITLGTAWGFKHKNFNKLVANCHKFPAEDFQKQLLNVESIDDALAQLESDVKSINASAKIIYTVSPVRHTKEGLIQNARSKAHLLAAVHQRVNAAQVSYFPAFEIMMDELRDYRFYKSDLIHPNTQAIQYIWELFSKTYLEPNMQPLLKEIEAIQKGLKHKPLQPQSVSYQEFKHKLSQRIKSLQDKWPHISFPNSLA